MADAARPTGEEHEAQLNEAILAHLKAKAGGGRLDRGELFARYPDVANALSDFLSAEAEVAVALASWGRVLPTTAPTRPESFGSYDVEGVLNQGGMGVVLRCRDRILNRPLAVKVLHEEYAANADVVRRFQEEAQIASQLQHPGIPPVHELGTLPDGRPYFAMKLVDGRDLAALLQDRATPAHDLPRFLTIFQQACQTVAYAHSKGVLHRDLKPLNIMVGAFGEVQVMDWGLGKVLRAGAPDGEALPVNDSGRRWASAARVATVRSDNPGVDTEAGWVAGTFPYMPPEQARGEIARVSKRSDVFSLGAILCQILTGHPPYTGATREELRQQAREAATGEAFARLESSGADRVLVVLAESCLAAEPESRPADAGGVAEVVNRYLDGVQEKLRASEVERARAEAKAAEERKKRRWQLGLAAVVLLAVAGTGVGGLWYQQDRAARATERARKETDTEREVTTALDEATILGQQAESMKADPVKSAAALTEALSAVKRAEGALITGEGSDALRRRVRAKREELEAADKDRRMIARLAEAQLRGAAASKGGFDHAGSVTLYAAAFSADMGLAALEPEQAADRINRRAIRGELLAALDNWATVTTNRGDAQRLHRILQAADPNPASFRNRWKAILARKDWKRLRKLASGPEVTRLPAVSLALLGRQLHAADAVAEAVRYLGAATDRHPSDFWIRFELAYALQETKPDATDEAIRHYTAALALRPGSAVVRNNLSAALREKHRLDEAIAESQRAIALDPDLALAHTNLGVALHDKGLLDEAIAELRKGVALQPGSSLSRYNLGLVLHDKRQFDEAILELIKAIALKPRFAEAYTNLGVVLYDKGLVDEAIARWREALALNPEDANAHSNLGMTLGDKGQLVEAIAECQQAVALKPDLAMAHTNLGAVLYANAQLDEAIAEYRKAIALKPDDANTHTNLGVALSDKRQLVEAIAEHRKAIALKPRFAEAHTNLGTALYAKGRQEEAIAEFRKAISLKPDDAKAHANLGVALTAKGQLDEAIKECRKAIALKPGLAEAHFNLGQALLDKDRVDDAMLEWRKGLAIKPGVPEVHYNLGLALHARGQLDEAILEYRKALELKPDKADARNNLGAALATKGQLDEAIIEYRKLIELQPDDVEAHYNLGLALADTDQLDEAIIEYRKAIGLKPEYAAAHSSLGRVLKNKGRLDEAIVEYRKAIALQPTVAGGYSLLGAALRRQGRLAESLAAYRRCHELGAKDPRWRRPSADWVRRAEELLKLEARLPLLLKGAAKPASPEEGLRFAYLCSDTRRYAAAARFFAESFTGQPDLANDPDTANRYNAACAAAFAGCGQGEDARTLTGKEHGRWRKQAHDWLRADLALWTKKVGEGKLKDRNRARKELRHWQTDSDLAAVRANGALARLPKPEQDEWRNLWADLGALLKQLDAAAPKFTPKK